MVGRRSPSGSSRRYPRSARVNEVLREVLADAIERIGDSDDRLAMVTVTGVESDPDLRHATVYLSSLSEAAAHGLEDHRARLQASIGSQVRMKRTPRLSFVVDPAVREGERVEEILRDLQSGSRKDGVPRNDNGGSRGQGAGT